jgi:nicotinamide mononucleotide transporter
MLQGFTLETVAVALAIAYLILAMRQNSLCWYCAFFSTAIYVYIFGDVNLYMESALNVYYMLMALYGWYQWRRGGDNGTGIAICRWHIKQHLLALTLIVMATMLSGYLLVESTDAKFPYLDSFTTWASIMTTLMVARKVLENWLYWIVINSLSLFIFIDRELYQTAAMLAVYLGLSCVGYITWRKAYHDQRATATAASPV